MLMPENCNELCLNLNIRVSDSRYCCRAS